jgi:RNA polymerase sigma factor (TIGR02999 family)
MLSDTYSEVTTLLDAIRSGDEEAKRRLVERVYRELHQVAAQLMRQEHDSHTLQPTALLHEAFVRLLRSDALQQSSNRHYLFGAAVRAMREVLVDHARQRRAGKRGGGLRREPFDALLAYYEEKNLDVVALHEALDDLATFHARQAQVVTLRFFGGCTVPEIAEQLGVSVSTVESDFRIARAWLRLRLGEPAGGE